MKSRHSVKKYSDPLSLSLGYPSLGIPHYPPPDGGGALGFKTGNSASDTGVLILLSRVLLFWIITYMHIAIIGYLFGIF